ncbi:lysophospholipase precursor [Aspergillus luchuensis]|uniref:Lysophospholipase n=1 Tax=Aspergillus kawachii TaxID=1069201 RepID=A0A146FCZ0_ASPKA|nr:lysophospholipase precursor [Aspergillus luchuensis]
MISLYLRTEAMNVDQSPYLGYVAAKHAPVPIIADHGTYPAEWINLCNQPRELTAYDPTVIQL